MTIPTSGSDNRSAVHPDPLGTAPGETHRPVAAIAVTTTLVTVLALLWAFYVESPWKHEAQPWGLDSEQGIAGLLWIAGFVALGVGVVYGVVVRRAVTRAPTRTARTGLILAIVGVPLAVVAFWTGLPIVLGSAATFLGVDARARLGRTPVTAAVAIGLGLLVAAAALFLCVIG